MRLGTHMRAARSAKGLTVAASSQVTGIPLERLADIEEGDRLPTGDELGRFAATGLLNTEPDLFAHWRWCRALPSPPRSAGRHSPDLSLAKKAAARLRISRSCFRSSRSSWRSSELRPSRSPTSPSNCLFQDRSVSSEIPSSSEITRSDLPLRRYSWTASRRNSGGYGPRPRLLPGIGGHPSCRVRRPSPQVSAKPGKLQPWALTRMTRGGRLARNQWFVAVANEECMKVSARAPVGHVGE